MKTLAVMIAGVLMALNSVAGGKELHDARIEIGSRTWTIGAAPVLVAEAVRGRNPCET
jgi:hypothetical protein